MKKKMIIGFTLFLLIMLVFTVTALAAENTLQIDTENIYEGMTRSYAQGYVPTISGGYAHFVLPLKSSDSSITSIVVSPIIGTDEKSPFVYGNYEFPVSPDGNSVFLVKLSVPLKSSRVNGTYPVTFRVIYSQGGTSITQEFPVYVSIVDGIDPNAPNPSPSPSAEPIVDQLRIDSKSLYEGMSKTYAQGYVPLVSNGHAYIILPLVGQTYDGKVTVTANLGATTASPFVIGNYSQTAGGWGTYVFVLDIPLSKDRYNGSYPVIIKADYLDVIGKKASQEFTVYVTIMDGRTPPDPNDIPKQAVEKPELFISSCSVEPNTVGGDEEFSVNVTVQNIGALRARSVRLTYGSEAAGIVPVETNNSIHLDNISSEGSVTASFKLKTTKDVLAGNQPFYLALDYVDLYGGVYTSTRTFLINVNRPVEIGYDSISVPKEVIAGETISLHANVFNKGKAPLRNVTVTVTGAGLFPISSVFLGDILPGLAGNGELKVFIGMLSMTEGFTESYGKTSGKYTISYADDDGEEYTISIDFGTEIKQPKIEDKEADKKLTEQSAFQWWVAVLVGLAIIAIIVAVITTTSSIRRIKMR